MKKTRKTKLFHKLTSLSLMTFLLLQPVLAMTVQAEDTAEATETEEPYVYTIPTEIISDESIEENGHIGRFAAGEREMNEICLLNDDGTNTMYIFDTPVKYVDDNGVVKDKSNKLHASKRNNYLYVNEENDVKTYFPKKITKKPVITEVGGYSIEIGIVTDSIYSKKGELLENNYVFYDKAFGDNTAIGYKPDFNGYKEEIILYSEEAPTSYSFEIYCYGLEVSKEGGVLVFTDEFSQCVVLTTDPFYIYDSSEQEKSYVERNYSLVKTDDYRYLMTIELDEEYIDSGLTYPVYIDPTVQYETTNSLHDAPIYSNKPYENFGSDTHAYVGYRNDEYGVGRILITCTQLAYSDFLQSFGRTDSQNELINVKLHMYGEPWGSSSATVTVHEFYGAEQWDENHVTWGSVSADGYSAALSSSMMSSTQNGYFSLHITEAAEHWIGNDMMSAGYIMRGLIVKSLREAEGESHYAKSIRTKDYGSTSAPYLTITYVCLVEEGDYYIKNAGSRLYTRIESNNSNSGTNVELHEFQDNLKQQWQITMENTGFYSIKNIHSGLYMSTSTSSTAIIQTPDKTAAEAQWCFHMLDNGNYVIYSKSSSATGMVLSVPSDTVVSGANLTQLSYANDTIYNDEWVLFNDIEHIIADFPYWYADVDNKDDSIGFWGIKTFVYKIEKAESDGFASIVSNAFDEWAEPLGITAINRDSDNFECDGCKNGCHCACGCQNQSQDEITEECSCGCQPVIFIYELAEEEYPWKNNENGRTTPTYYPYVDTYYGIYGNEKKESKPIKKANVRIREKPSILGYPNTVTHEIGHALGYLGHSSNEFDLMQAHQTSYSSSLSTRDINHLKQVFDLIY